MKKKNICELVIWTDFINLQQLLIDIFDVSENLNIEVEFLPQKKD